MKQLRSKTGAKALRKEWKHNLDSGTQICFLLQEWEDAYNVGGLFRVADGVGATELVMTGRTPQPPNPMISVTSIGAHRRIPFRHFEKHDEAAKKLIEEGWSLIAVEIADNSVNFHEFEFPEKTCLVLGNEALGVYGSVMKFVSNCVFIPMFGKGRSLNVHVAAAIVAYQARLKR